MSADEVKERLTLEMTIDMLEYYGAEAGTENDEYIPFTSICHQSDSKKLYLYKNTNSLYCWVCGAIDLIAIVEEMEDLSFQEALQFVIDYFELDKPHFGRPKWKNKEHKQREFKKKEIDFMERLPIYEESILNTFIDYQAVEWQNEGISVEVMKQFEISYDLNSHTIVIPHRDYEGKLVGIRIRNLDKKKCEMYGKYTVYTDILNKKMYKHKLSLNLYGLYQNLENIKRYKKVIIFESEKSVLLMNTYYPNDSIAVAPGGSIINEFQLHLLKMFGVEEVIFCFDYELEEKILKKMDKCYKRSALLFDTYIMDSKLMNELLEEKDSPIDVNKEVFEELLINKIQYLEQ